MRIFAWIVLAIIALGTVYLAADILGHKIKIKEKLRKNHKKSQKNE